MTSFINEKKSNDNQKRVCELIHLQHKEEYRLHVFYTKVNYLSGLMFSIEGFLVQNSKKYYFDTVNTPK